jgi:hypothetical protein
LGVALDYVLEDASGRARESSFAVVLVQKSFASWLWGDRMSMCWPGFNRSISGAAARAKLRCKTSCKSNHFYSEPIAIAIAGKMVRHSRCDREC